ncbi:unnamed protein product [Orchesella dallaii]|uniref:Uncharacterized protein n=1 Tax=Orchesella dallaii TaxID=48710 RepID=A0ABP1Q9P6_9HEXA
MDSCKCAFAVVLSILSMGGVKIVCSQVYMTGAIPLKEPNHRNPVMYSSVTPIIYQFRMPKWDIHTMKIQFWKDHNNCTKSDKYEDGYPCPIMYHLNDLIEDFSKNMTTWANAFLKENGQETTDFLEDPTILWSPKVCSDLRIEPHFKAFRTSSENIGKYIDALMKCTENRSDSSFQIIDKTNVSISLENMYHYTFTSYTADYWSNFTETIARESAALTMWSLLESTLMTHQYMEAQKWTHAVTTCKNHQIPWTLIDTVSLEQLLSRHRSSFEETHDLAIPLEDISKYFKLPISDCIFGDDNTFNVRLLVPLIPKEAASKNYFVKFHPVPFQTQGKVCSLWDGKESVEFNLGLNGIIPCSCAKSDLFCKGWITQDNCLSSFVQETCLHSLHSDLEESIVKHCPLKCKTIGSEPQQYDWVVARNSTHTTKIIPAPIAKSNPTVIKCSNGTMTLDLKSVGAYQIIIPSGCRTETVVGGYDADANYVKSLDGVSIEQMLPYHWRNSISSQDSSEEDEGGNFIESVEMLEGLDSKVYLLASKLQQLDQYSCNAISDTFLWLLVLLSIVMNIGLAVIVVHLYKWKKVETYKSSRLVYNVSPPEDNDFPIHDNPGSPLYSDVF